MSKELPPLAKALRHARAAAGLSQAALAKLAGVSRPTIATLEIGLHQNAQADTIKKLAKALNIPSSELIGPTDANQSEALRLFLKSPIAEMLSLTKEERVWLRALHNDWPAGELTPRSFFFVIEALRSSK
jgi:transcriptional regulator with XRE-family HTH domain